MALVGSCSWGERRRRPLAHAMLANGPAIEIVRLLAFRSAAPQLGGFGLALSPLCSRC